jgi:hypothetical protein
LIAFRNCDSRYPFLWEDSSQPAARWHGNGEGPAHYFADTPDGAWAELIRHEEITKLADVASIRRAIWAVDLDPSECETPALAYAILTGDEATYDACRTEARSMRAAGGTGIVAPSAALKPGEASGFRVDHGLQRTPARNGRGFVLFGPRPDLTGWLVAPDARPSARILDQTRPL